jgi:hypothetical protein
MKKAILDIVFFSKLSLDQFQQDGESSVSSRLLINYSAKIC